MKKVFVYDPTASDSLSAVRGVGRYLQILKENFPSWTFTDNLKLKHFNNKSIFINPFFNFLKKPLTMKRLAKKQIAVIHDLIPLKYPSHFPVGIKGKINIFLNKIALKNYDLIITDSESSKKDIINILGLSDNKVKVIYPCLPKLFLKPENKASNNNLKFNPDKFVLYVGDATWNKNLVNLAKAIKIANVSCVFVGKVFDQMAKVTSEKTLREADCRDNQQSLAEEKYHEQLDLTHPWQKELRQFLTETKDDKRFIFLGFVPDIKLISLYKKATLNILPSYDEGFGFSYLEAAQFSCPSVLSNISVLKEISDNNALFADPNNPNDLADKIGEIYFNKNIKVNLGIMANKRSKYFNSSIFQKEFSRYL